MRGARRRRPPSPTTSAAIVPNGLARPAASVPAAPSVIIQVPIRRSGLEASVQPGDDHRGCECQARRGNDGWLPSVANRSVSDGQSADEETRGEGRARARHTIASPAHSCQPVPPLRQRDRDQHRRPQQRQLGQESPTGVEPAGQRGEHAGQRRLGRRLGILQHGQTNKADDRPHQQQTVRGPPAARPLLSTKQPPARERPFAVPLPATVSCDDPTAPIESLCAEQRVFSRGIRRR